MSAPAPANVPQNTSNSAVPEANVPQIAVPKGSRVILTTEKLTAEAKKVRSEKQQEAYKRMRAALDESRQKRQFSRKEALEKLDELKEEERQKEAEERQRQADALKAQGVEVVVQKRRGRKPGDHTPYGTTKKAVAAMKETPEETLQRMINDALTKAMAGQAPPITQHKSENPNINVPIVSPPLSAAVSQAPPTNPYLEMIRRKRR